MRSVARTTVDAMPTSPAARWLGVAVLVLLGVPTGCAADPTASGPPPAGSSRAPAASPLPATGVRLTALGFSHGPLDTFSLPRTSVLRAAVDQPDNVTVVLSAPSPRTVTAYLRRSLPATGFRVSADRAAVHTLTFTGYGWSGSVTGNAGTTAVLLRPL